MVVSRTAGSNLDPTSADRLLRAGVLCLGLSLALSVALLHGHVAISVRWVLVLPFFAAFYGLFAGMSGTCGVRAVAGLRVTREGAESVADRDERRRLRRSGALVLARIAAASAVATLALVWAG